MTYAPLPIEELDAMPAAEFAAAIDPLFEGAPGLVARLAGDRPYGSWWALLQRARVIAHALPEDAQVELLNAHPRLGAPPESVSRLSFEEQGYGRAEDAPSITSTPTPRPAPVDRAPTPLSARLAAAQASKAERPTWGSRESAGAADAATAAGAAASAPGTVAGWAGPASEPGAGKPAAVDGPEVTRDKLARLNAAYEDWFGFRYCVFVAGRPLEALVPELEAALAKPRDEELRRGIDAVIDIGIARSGAAR